MTDLSIVIVNWNTRDLLARCLQAVNDTTRDLDFETIVVDNASSDDSVAMVEELYPQVRVVANSENVGFGRANNQAVSWARGRYLLLLNPDAFVHEGTVERLVGFMDAHPDAGAAGCRLFYEDGTLQRSCAAFPTVATELWAALWLDKLFPAHPVFGKYLMTYWDMGDVREVDSLLGACLILRREAIDKTGLFDEQFFMYSEEVDLCMRLKRAGWKIYFVADAEATHTWGGSARKIQAESFLRLFKSRVLFFRKHYGRSTAWLYKLVLLLRSFLRVAVGSTLFIVRKDEQVIKFRNYRLLLRCVWTF
jgi:GT2 family glycosyltransferase